MERIPQQEISNKREITLKHFERFLNLPANPRYSYEEQEKLEKMILQSKDASKKFKESKKDQKHTSTINGVIGMAELFLKSDEAKDVSEELRSELMTKIETIYTNLEKATQKKNISDELVESVKEIIYKVKPFLE